MTRHVRVAAVDLGATSGRVMVGTVGSSVSRPDALRLEEVHRFPTGPRPQGGLLTWDIEDIYRQVLTGLRHAGAGGPVHSVAIDSWAVDYGLLDQHGHLLGPPVSHRDPRTEGVMEEVLRQVPAQDLYAVTGLQFLPFNTVYQLVVDRREGRLDEAATVLLLPDLLTYRLTGAIGAEETNASTTQLYDVQARDWSDEILRRVGLPREVLPPIHRPGARVGTLRPDVADAVGQPESTPVLAVGSHDTASAVVGVPMRSPGHAAYISSGTWSLVGVELAEPVLTEEARRANFTNERGVDGTIRFLRNVSGLWVLNELLRAHGRQDDLSVLLAEAARAPALRTVADLEAPEFLAPGDMGPRIAEQCRRTGQDPPSHLPELVRTVLESLAVAYRRAVRGCAEVSGRQVEVVHVVGGGARNALLCQLTADACGLPVLAGPVEAAALGNVLVQARSLGADLPDLAAMRDLVGRTHRLRRFDPSGDSGDWDRAEALLGSSWG
jgi:rhamnulokinase